MYICTRQTLSCIPFEAISLYITRCCSWCTVTSGANYTERIPHWNSFRQLLVGAEKCERKCFKNSQLLVRETFNRNYIMLSNVFRTTWIQLNTCNRVYCTMKRFSAMIHFLSLFILSWTVLNYETSRLHTIASLLFFRTSRWFIEQTYSGSIE